MLLGKGALIAKTDIKSAYSLVPVHPNDRKWLGMEWDGKIYIDGMLPFGLRSAPQIFSAIADAIEWCVVQEGVNYIFHYLDDFAVLGAPQSESCSQELFKLKKVCHELPCSRERGGAQHHLDLPRYSDRYCERCSLKTSYRDCCTQ